MSYPNEICSLVIRNMNIVEKLPQVINEIETNMIEAINDRIEEIKLQNEWTTGKNWDNTITNCFYPPRWQRENQIFRAYYHISWVGNADLNWLSYAVNIMDSKLALYFDTERPAQFNNAQWGAIVEAFYQNNHELKKRGFKYDQDMSSCIFIPFYFNSEKMAEEYPNLDECLKPLDDVLARLLECNKIFTEFVEQYQERRR